MVFKFSLFSTCHLPSSSTGARRPTPAPHRVNNLFVCFPANNSPLLSIPAWTTTNPCLPCALSSNFVISAFSWFLPRVALSHPLNGSHACTSMRRLLTSKSPTELLLNPLKISSSLLKLGTNFKAPKQVFWICLEWERQDKRVRKFVAGSEA